MTRCLLAALFMGVGNGSNRRYPMAIRLVAFEPAEVVVDPDRAFGQPILTRSRVRVADLAAMVGAGEDPHDVAVEYEVTDDEVRAAARVLLGKAD